LYTIEQDSTAPFTSPNVAQLTYPADFAGGRSPGTLQTQWFPTVHGVDYKQLYINYVFKISHDFHGHVTTTNKIVHYWVASGNRIFDRMVGADDNPLEYQVGLQGPAPDCETRSRLIPNQGASGNIERGEWHVVELQLILNNAGQCDGVFRVWINDTMIMEYGDVGILESGEDARVFNQVQLSPTWGGGGDVTPHSFFMWLDQVYVSGHQ
jgi:hypothetical protein